ncbi:molybdopterin synthase [Salinirubellus salinus]|uniref:Molybdopterin synthase n=1 Tax=Salinirubellus salinus TaxID=1364945 RepID=A0A9E7UA99_9EURY|nr:molybdopterin synthase [Salinirubellus salinus]UWM56776.1 molybdopterin synthase [Salinirubellus salinus]
MRTLAICGPDSGTLADRLADRLDGRVGVVHEAALDGGVTTGTAATTYRYGETGWQATGRDDLSLDDVLDRLAPDHEYALVLDVPADLPTVALGGTDAAGEVLVRADSADAVDLERLTEALADVEPRETLESLVARVKRSPKAPYSGAIATFTGRVRAKEHDEDAPTEYLQFEKYEGVADRRMRTIETELEEREGVLEVVMHHRTGVVPDGEDIVFVVVLAAHRGEAFETVEDGIDRLKDEVPLFKKEVTAEETFWVHERD